ncbi:MAG: bifunctional metallophosphatase/5'-nucleotidase, partial [Staphylococcus epidermidis]|nr:bifunctional metallophosphatase/5'-nucleotidase [Staphylococcus epidermidis]
AHIDFNKRQLSMTMIDETLFTVWQGFDYCIDMSQSPFNRVKLNGLNEEDSYRITMTDYCYRNYKMYLQEAIVHDTYSETMGGLIRKNLKCDMYSVKLNHNFKVY